MKKIKQKIYKIKAGANVKKEDFQVVGEYIDSIGKRDPQLILKKAKKDKNCPLNKYLDWNDKTAGDKWRLFQIRNIINHIEVKIVYEGGEKNTKAFYSITEDDKQYVSLTEAMKNTDWRQQIIDRALQEQLAWIERYEIYDELKPLISAIKPYVERIKEE